MTLEYTWKTIWDTHVLLIFSPIYNNWRVAAEIVGQNECCWKVWSAIRNEKCGVEKSIEAAKEKVLQMVEYYWVDAA